MGEGHSAIADLYKAGEKGEQGYNALFKTVLEMLLEESLTNKHMHAGMSMRVGKGVELHERH